MIRVYALIEGVWHVSRMSWRVTTTTACQPTLAPASSARVFDILTTDIGSDAVGPLERRAPRCPRCPGDWGPVVPRATVTE